jgi:D-alanyl-D-alanine dipeptidase
MTSVEPILLSDSRIGAIAWADDGDPLVDLRGGPLRLDRRLADPVGAYARLRAGVVERLVAAQAALPAGLALLIIEGYRPPALQRDYFDEYLAQLQTTYPGWDAHRRRVEASKFISPPEVAPHGTGGAVDLTLCTAAGTELDLGTAVNASPEESRNACYTAAPDISANARELRDILVTALTGAGLVNYPTEWWHWSYGERYWALQQGLPRTRYAPVDVTTLVPAPSTADEAPTGG